MEERVKLSSANSIIMDVPFISFSANDSHTLASI